MMKALNLVLSATLILVFSLSFGELNQVAFAATMPEIQKRGYLTVAVKDNLRPLGFRDENGSLQGLEVDLARKLAADLLGKADAVKFKPVLNGDRLPSVFNHQVDLAIAQITATESRSRIVSFSVPYYYDGAAVVTKNTKIKNFEDLKQRKIGVLNHSSTISYIKYFIPNADLVGVNSYSQGKEQIENNQVDGFAGDISVLSGWVQENSEYRILSTKLSTQPLSVTMPKGLQYDDLRRNVNEAIARYTVTGWLKERCKYWGLE
ncbi:MAG: ABC transporter substrate-binding protein [Nostocales cyanobacterium]|nr:MAG: ABC transporter substrate-binding protein [Nostocales cyanobacterium]TAF05362.1 MAG: ABC transporter substrate-binding protein [Nostocales cyanobacterium]